MRLDERLGGDAAQERLDVASLSVATFADLAVRHEGRHGPVDDVVALNVVCGEVFLFISKGRLEGDPEGADLVEHDGLGVEQVAAHGVEELDEHGGHVGAGNGGGVADLLGKGAGVDGAQADGSAVPLALELAVLQRALVSFESDRHNGNV